MYKEKLSWRDVKDNAIGRNPEAKSGGQHSCKKMAHVASQEGVYITNTKR